MSDLALALIQSPSAAWPAAAVMIAAIAGIAASRLSAHATKRQRLRTEQAEASAAAEEARRWSRVPGTVVVEGRSE